MLIQMYVSNFKSVISDHMIRMKSMRTSCEIALRWMPKSTFDEKSVLVQVMALCRQATAKIIINTGGESETIYVKVEKSKIIDHGSRHLHLLTLSTFTNTSCVSTGINQVTFRRCQ